jgi:hypothetical protein
MMLQSEATPGEDEMNPTVKRSGWHAPEDTGLWAIADRVAAEACTCIISICLSCNLLTVHPCIVAICMPNIDNAKKSSSRQLVLLKQM